MRTADSVDYYANLTRVPYIIPEFDQYVETPFSPTEDNFDNCDVDRPSPDTPVDDRMIFANHNLNDEFAGILVPARDEAEQTNSLDSIGRQSDLCVDNHGRKPNVVMVCAIVSFHPHLETAALAYSIPVTPYREGTSAALC